MENKNRYEKTRRILEENIIRLMMEKNLTARALSIRIEKNEWYITRMLNGKIDPSLQVICKIAEVLHVSVADLFAKKSRVKKLWDLSGPTLPKPIVMGEGTVLY